MEVHTVTVGELDAFVHSSWYEQLASVPISIRRALSQAQNPRADSNDVALIIAHKSGRICSYVGLLPDILETPTGSQKIYWNSGWWADEKTKDNGGMLLFYAAIKAAKGQLFFPDLTPHTQKIVAAIKGFTVQEKPGFRAFLKVVPDDFLQSSRLLIKRLHPILKPLSILPNALVQRKQKQFLRKYARSGISHQNHHSIDKKLGYFIHEHSKNYVFQRSTADFNWILEHPWLSTQFDEQRNQEYHFSLFDASFQNLVVSVYASNRLCGVMMLLFRKGMARLSYLFCKEEDLPACAQTLVALLIEKKTSSLLSFDERLLKHFKTGALPFVFIRAQKRYYAYPSNNPLHSDAFQDGDGDTAFA